VALLRHFLPKAELPPTRATDAGARAN